jgi:hypothetical protein
VEAVVVQSGTGPDQAPDGYSERREVLLVVLWKENQLIHVVMRQPSDDHSLPAIHEDIGTPAMILYGAQAEWKVMKAEGLMDTFEEIV